MNRLLDQRILQRIGSECAHTRWLLHGADVPSSFRSGFSKFRAFDLTEYDHILLLDSNTLVLSRDVYNIFDIDVDFAGVSV